MGKRLLPQTIVHGKKTIDIFPVYGDIDSIGIDRATGDLYWRYWDPRRDRSTTPHQRSHEHVDARHLRWRRVGKGILTLERAVMHALASGELRILELKEWKSLLNDAQYHCVAYQQGNLKAKKLAQQQMMRVAQGLQRAHVQELREGYKQLALAVIYKDSRGRPNEGMVMCRTRAAFDRLVERIGSIAIWSGDYRHLLERIQSENDYFNRSLKKLIALLENTDSHLDVQKISLIRTHFMMWVHIPPYSEWIIHTIDDLNALELRVHLGRHENAQKLQLKILGYTHYKKVQVAIHKLILTLTFEKSTSAIYINEALDEVMLQLDTNVIIDTIDVTLIDKVFSLLAHASALTHTTNRKELLLCLKEVESLF
jgi:hypothetical protein